MPCPHFAGEIIGNGVCELREVIYDRLGIADYMFRIGTYVRS